MIDCHFMSHFTLWKLIPCVMIAEHRCDSAECRDLHGISIDIGFLCWSFIIDWMF